MNQQLLAAPESLIGSVLLGRYRVVRELARGGMGVVFLARSEGARGFRKPVVIKLLLPEHTEDEHMVRMFAREARILSQLRHPSLVDVIEFNEQEGGSYVLVLEYVRGYHLGLWLRYLTLKKRDVPVQIVLQIMIDVLDALHHAHTQVHPDGTPMHIVHRDVSPSNILLDETGRARLLDFGVARMRGGSHDYKTQVQGFMGKLPYTAPEVFAGNEASPQSDLYACAVVLYEVLSGQNLFRAETQAATLQRILHHVPEPLYPNLPGATPELDRVLARALAKMPEARHADAREFALDLRKLQEEDERDIRARLADLLKVDFGAEMAALLRLDSLAERDAAWRYESDMPPPPRETGRPLPAVPTTPSAGTATPRRPSQRSAHADSASTMHGLSTPAPIGNTVAASPGARIASRHAHRIRTQDDFPSFETPTPPSAHSSSSLLQEPDSRPTLRVPEELSSRGLSEPSEVPTTPRPQLPPESTTRGQRRGWSAVVLAGAMAFGALAGLFGLRHGLTPAAGATERNTTPVVRSARPTQSATAGAAAPAPHPVEASATATEIAPVDNSAATTAAKASLRAAMPASKQPRPKRPAAAPDAGALTRAVRKQQPKLEACFKEHSLALEGQPTTQLEFDLADDGTLMRVELSPRALASTSLGQCLLRVARNTPFPPQARAVSFVIPLTASTARGG